MFLESPKNLPSVDAGDLVVRLIEKNDVDRLYDFVNDNKDHLVPWEPERADFFYSKEGCRQRIMHQLLLQSHGLSYYFLIFEPDITTKVINKIAGVIHYSNIFQFPLHACQLGYSLAKFAQGRGIMTQALAASNRWMFDQLHLHRIMASYIPRNKRSATVLRRLGFVREGFAKNYLLINGRWEDHILTSLINPHWSNGEHG